MSQTNDHTNVRKPNNPGNGESVRLRLEDYIAIEEVFETFVNEHKGELTQDEFTALSRVKQIRLKIEMSIMADKSKLRTKD